MVFKLWTQVLLISRFFECFIKRKQCWNIEKEHFGNFGLIPTFYLLNLQQSYSLLYHAETKFLSQMKSRWESEIVKMVNKYWHSTDTRVWCCVILDYPKSGIFGFFLSYCRIRAGVPSKPFQEKGLIWDFGLIWFRIFIPIPYMVLKSHRMHLDPLYDQTSDRKWKYPE